MLKNFVDERVRAYFSSFDSSIWKLFRSHHCSLTHEVNIKKTYVNVNHVL